MSRTSRALVFLTTVSLPLSIAKADEGMAATPSAIATP